MIKSNTIDISNLLNYIIFFLSGFILYHILAVRHSKWNKIETMKSRLY